MDEVSGLIGRAEPGRVSLRPPTVQAGQAAPATKDVAQVRRAAQEFEAIVLGQMLKTMRQASATGPVALTGTSQKLYRDLMDDELAKVVSKKGGVGLADILVRDLLRLGPGPKKALKSPEPPADSRPVGSEPSEGATR